MCLKIIRMLLYFHYFIYFLYKTNPGRLLLKTKLKQVMHVAMMVQVLTKTRQENIYNNVKRKTPRINHFLASKHNRGLHVWSVLTHRWRFHL